MFDDVLHSTRVLCIMPILVGRDFNCIPYLAHTRMVRNFHGTKFSRIGCWQRFREKIFAVRRSQSTKHDDHKIQYLLLGACLLTAYTHKHIRLLTRVYGIADTACLPPLLTV